MAFPVAAAALVGSQLVGPLFGKTRKVVVDQSVQKSAPGRLKTFADTQNRLADMAVNTQMERSLPNFDALDEILASSSRNALAQNDAFEQETNPHRFAARKAFESSMEDYLNTPTQTQKDLQRLGLWSAAGAGGTPRADSVGQSAARAVYGRGADAENARRLNVVGNYLAANPQVEVTASPRSKANAAAAFEAGGVNSRNARTAGALDMASEQANQQLSFGEQILAQLIAELKGQAQAQTQISQLKADQRDRVIGGIQSGLGAMAGSGTGSAFGQWLGDLFAGSRKTPVGGTPGFNPQAEFPNFSTA